jgi:RimJ/RimL family protein N-acetyltransferase
MNVELRDMREDDLPTLFGYQLDPVATEMAAFPARDWEAFLAHSMKIMADDTVVVRVVLADGVVAGDIASFERLGVREVGYWFGRDHWGKGVATKGLAAFLTHDPTRPLYARVVVHNVASIRVLEKCGFAIVEAAQEQLEPLGDGVEEVVLRLDAEAPTDLP